MLGERIVKARKKAGFSSQEKFAKALGIGKRTLADYEKDKSDPQVGLLKKIAEICNVDEYWLLTGRNNPANFELPEPTSNSINKAISDTAAINLPEAQDVFAPCNEEDTYSIPALSVKAAAGGGNNLESIDAFESFATINIDKMLFKTAPTQKLRAIQVDGYSMAPMLMPDSWVIFELDRGYDGDGLYIINWRNVLMVKKVQLNMDTGRFEIISTNPDYDSYSVDPDDQSVFRIIGKVIRAII